MPLLRERTSPPETMTLSAEQRAHQAGLLKQAETVADVIDWCEVHCGFSMDAITHLRQGEHKLRREANEVGQYDGM